MTDVAYATSRLSQFNTRPTEGSKAALLRVLGYLKGIPRLSASVAGSAARLTRFVSTVTLIMGDSVSLMAGPNLV